MAALGVPAHAATCGVLADAEVADPALRQAGRTCDRALAVEHSGLCDTACGAELTTRHGLDRLVVVRSTGDVVTATVYEAGPGAFGPPLRRPCTPANKGERVAELVAESLAAQVAEEAGEDLSGASEPVIPAPPPDLGPAAPRTVGLYASGGLLAWQATHGGFDLGVAVPLARHLLLDVELGAWFGQRKQQLSDDTWSYVLTPLGVGFGAQLPGEVFQPFALLNLGAVPWHMELGAHFPQVAPSARLRLGADVLPRPHVGLRIDATWGGAFAPRIEERVGPEYRALAPMLGASTGLVVRL